LFSFIFSYIAVKVSDKVLRVLERERKRRKKLTYGISCEVVSNITAFLPINSILVQAMKRRARVIKAGVYWMTQALGCVPGRTTSTQGYEGDPFFFSLSHSLF
jgi:hydroxymethylpyrimidine/phosphomethylpyrimidine kinase